MKPPFRYYLAFLTCALLSHAAAPYIARPFRFADATIDDLQQQMAAGRLTARELTSAYLDRIEEIDRAGPRLNAIIELNPDALDIAERLEGADAGGAVHFGKRTNRVADEPFDTRIEAILRHWQAPGAVLTVVKDGVPWIQRGYGRTKAQGGEPVTEKTLTSVASVTKTINAVALAILVEAGAIDWDDPVIRHVPEFSFGGEYRTKHTTLRDLIAHRSGMPRVMGTLWDMEYDIAGVLRDLRHAEPVMGFRERTDYCQVGIALLDEVVGRVAKMPWAKFVESRIFEPLGMRSSYAGTRSFTRAHPNAESMGGLMGRAVRRAGQIVDTPWRGPGELYRAAGGVVTTGEDMAKYIGFLLNGGQVAGRRLLSADSVASLYVPVGLEGSSYGAIVNPTGALVNYCLGWIAHDYAGQRIVEHPGSHAGSSVIALIPARRIGVFVSSNATYSLDSDRMVSALKFTALDHALGLPPADWIERLATPHGD